MSGQSFAVALGGEGEGAGPGAGLGRSVVVWGAGDRRHLSRDEPWLGWSGDLSAFHLGADAALGSGVIGGLGVSWFESRMDYVDRSEDEPIEGVHRSRMASVQPYVGWSSSQGARLWASLGYGSGEIEIEDQALLERYGRQRSGSRLVAHRSGVEEWGLTGGLRLAPRANGRGLSLSVSPGWGEAGSGVSRLWEEGMAGRGETAEAGSGVGVEAEVGYGVGAFGGFGVATPYTRFGQAREERRYGLGWRLDRRPGDGFALDLGVWRRERATERPEHGVASTCACTGRRGGGSFAYPYGSLSAACVFRSKMITECGARGLTPGVEQRGTTGHRRTLPCIEGGSDGGEQEVVHA